MENGAIASKEQMLHLPKYFKIHDILKGVKFDIMEYSVKNGL